MANFQERLNKYTEPQASDLWKIWLEGISKLRPTGTAPITFGEKPYYLDPSDILKYIAAISPWELFREKRTPLIAGLAFNYPSVGANIRPPISMREKPEAIMYATKTPENLLMPLTGLREYIAENYPIQQRRFGTPAIHAHEMGHFRDPRISPTAANYPLGIWDIYNKALARRRMWELTRRLPPRIASEELPAVIAEDIFWENLRRGER